MRVRVRSRAGDLELRARPIDLIEPIDLTDGELLQLDEQAVTQILQSALTEGHEHLYRSLLGHTRRGWEIGTRRPLLEQLARAVARGELLLVRRALQTVSGTRPEPPPEYVPPHVEDEVLDWIEILIEDQDGRPLREIGYEITLPDGAVRRGRTTREGIVRLDEIPRGDCKFTLTDFDESAWEAP